MLITPAARRARLGRRHLLAPSTKAERMEDVAEALVGLHATDAPTVVLSAWARLREPSLADMERALYTDRTLLRMHCMRRTLFAVPTPLVPVFHFSTGVGVAARERARLLGQLAAADPAWDEAWLDAARREALAALESLGEARAADVTAAVPALQESIVLSPGKRYESRQRIGGHVLRLLAMEGLVRRGRPVGGWTSGQFRYRLAPELPELGPDDATAELVRRWLARYGPGTAEDLKWWTGLSLTQVRRALRRLEPARVEVAEGEAWVLPDDLEEPPEPKPWAALLPALDPSTMGWKHRDWYVDPAHRPRLFDGAGNAGPTVWWNGEIIGAWAQRRDGKVVWRLLADRGAQARAAVAAEAERLQDWLDDRRLVVRFPSPMYDELTAPAD